MFMLSSSTPCRANAHDLVGGDTGTDSAAAHEQTTLRSAEHDRVRDRRRGVRIVVAGDTLGAPDIH
jgi:hypothetical protein